jgi:predicted enzyme related to lactoylglutathione lyase
MPLAPGFGPGYDAKSRPRQGHKKQRGGIMADKIDYIEFPSQDRAQTSAFFQTAFGWGIVSYGPSYDALADAGIDGGIDQGEQRVATTIAIIRTDDLDGAEQRVRAAGGVITRAQFDFPGGRRFHFREPGGNELAVWTPREVSDHSEGA